MGLPTDSRLRSSQQAAPYSPRKSNRIDENAIELTPDGDVWQEKICVCEGLGGKDGKTPRLVLKSYFRNNRTLHKVWDEPPTGASTVRYASSKDRRKAEAQLKELQSTLNMIPAEEQAGSASSTSSPNKKGKNVVDLLLGTFRRKKDKPAIEVHDSQDVNLQKAIARSMMDRRHPQETSTSASSDGSLVSPVVRYDPESPTRDSTNSNPLEHLDDDEEAALAEALALSLSESNVPSATVCNVPPRGVESLSEEELLHRAIVESRRTEERRKDRAVYASARDSPRRHSRSRHERQFESRDKHSRHMAEFRAVDDADDADWDRKPKAATHATPSRRHTDSQPYVTDGYRPRYSKPTYNRRKVTRAKDPPSEPPSQYMEDDDNEDGDLDFEALYNEVDDDMLWKTKRASSHPRGSYYGTSTRTPSGRKAY